MNNEKKLFKLIAKYFKNLKKCDEIIKYLYDHTELFEKKYMNEFPEELFRFFSGKIGNYTKQKNTLYKLLTNREAIILREIEILEVE